MNYYENKMLQDRERRTLASGVVFILMSPIFAVVGMIIGGVFGSVGAGFWIGFVGSIIFGISGIVGRFQEKRERLSNQHS